MLAFAGIDIDLAGTIGLGELLVAVGTLALAMFTAWLAFETRSLAQETEEDVSAEWRPVLMTQTTLQVVFDDQSDSAVASLGLYNEGRGPAMNARGWIVAETSSRRAEGGLHQIGTVAANREGNVAGAGLMLHDSERGAQPQLVYTVVAEYEDLSERTHRTELTFEDPEHGKRAAAVRELNLPVTRAKVVGPRRPGRWTSAHDP